MLYGKTSDISVFQFPWFSPIWFYDPSHKMPEHKMCPGYFLGIEENIGDAFTYQILPVKDITKAKGGRCKHLTRSVIRLRDVTNDDKPPIVKQDVNMLQFFDIEGNELIGDDILQSKQTESTTKVLNDSADNTINISKDDTTTTTSDSISTPIKNCDIITMDGSSLEEFFEKDSKVMKLLTTTPSKQPFDNCNKIPVASPNSYNDSTDHDSTTISDENEIPAMLKRPSDDSSITTFDSDCASFNDESTNHISQDLNDHFVVEDEDYNDVAEILGHTWIEGVCELEVCYYDNEF